MNFFETTKFSCHFWWGAKERGFAIFYGRLVVDYCGQTDENIFWWVAKADGFIIANMTHPPPNYLHKLNVWI